MPILSAISKNSIEYHRKIKMKKAQSSEFRYWLTHYGFFWLCWSWCDILSEWIRCPSKMCGYRPTPE
ncbi:unnamed protein product [Blepharisma stoltei]|uniref:Uncharacterized protein n=1 Tax=Blepharisma stoltei TaxID=1481888 RepID=A0AAU9J427_9CILI|nr:unnamed protein product [Blepharisma stoltei]